MIKHKDHFHGSDLEKIEQIYGIKKKRSSVFPQMSIRLAYHRFFGPLSRADRCDHDIP